MEVPSSITDKEIHNYLSEIKHQLTFTHSPKETASIMQMIESSIDDFLSEHPSATIKDLTNHFGSTDEFKEMFISCAESEQLENHLNNSQKRRKYAKLTLIVIIFILLTCAGFYIKSCIDLEKSIPAYEIIRIE